MRGSMKTLFLSEAKCSCTSMATAGATLNWQKMIKSGPLADGRARPHRWAPEAGYVTLIVHKEEDLEPAMDLIRMSHSYFADKQKLSRIQHQ